MTPYRTVPKAPSAASSETWSPGVAMAAEPPHTVVSVHGALPGSRASLLPPSPKSALTGELKLPVPRVSSMSTASFVTVSWRALPCKIFRSVSRLLHCYLRYGANHSRLLVTSGPSSRTLRSSSTTQPEETELSTSSASPTFNGLDTGSKIAIGYQF